MREIFAEFVIVQAHEVLRERLTKTQLLEVYKAIRKSVREIKQLPPETYIPVEAYWEDAEPSPELQSVLDAWDGDKKQLQLAVKKIAMCIRNGVEDLHVEWQARGFGQDIMQAFNRAVRRGVLDAILVGDALERDPICREFMGTNFTRYRSAIGAK